MISHARLRSVIFPLLAGNSIYYVVAGRTSEALDSVAWFTLLILFTLESLYGNRMNSPRILAVVRGVRLLAAAAVGAAAIGYVTEREWHDAANIVLWIAVVALLEIEIRHPAAVARRRALFTRTAVVFYSTLVALVVIWLARGEWMDAWDAALWFAAFGVLELDVLNAAVAPEYSAG